MKELNNFITLLDTTLHMNNAIEVSDEEEEELKPAERHSAHILSQSPEPQPSQKIHKSISMPSKYVLCEKKFSSYFTLLI